MCQADRHEIAVLRIQGEETFCESLLLSIAHHEQGTR